MALVTEVLILVDHENDSELSDICKLITQLDYMWATQRKSVNLAQTPPCQIILFNVGHDFELDNKILRDLRSQVAYLPIVAMTGETMNIPPAIAKLSNSILHTPTTAVTLERKILRHLEPREGHHVRVYNRAETRLKVTWRYEKTNTPKESETANISRGGAFIRENHFYPNRGDIVEVIIRNEKATISSKAIVRWIYSPGSASNNAPGFGIEFLTLTRSGQRLFESLGL